MSVATNARPYRIPSASVYVDVSLDEFSLDQIREYLQNRGEVDAGEGAYITPTDLARAETLVLCGQRDAARELVLGIVGEAMGRPL